MEFVTNLMTAFTLSYLWMTVIAVKNIIVDQEATTPKEFWIWVGVLVSLMLTVKYLF
jgi:hypothetical protein